jgi:hypothetical protein
VDVQAAQRRQVPGRHAFDAAAVKYNFDRIQDPKTASAQLKNDLGR